MSSFWQTKIDETKKFVKKHQVPIACAATAVTVIVIGKGVHQTSEQFYKGMYNGMVNSVKRDDLQLLTLLEFIDYKDLTHEFEKFSRQQNG